MVHSYQIVTTTPCPRANGLEGRTPEHCQRELSQFYPNLNRTSYNEIKNKKQTNKNIANFLIFHD